MRDDLHAAYDRGHRTLDEMTPTPRWQQRLGAWLLIGSAVLVITGLYACVSLPAVVLYELAFGR